MNEDDSIGAWVTSGLLRTFERICSEDLLKRTDRSTHYVELSPMAWGMAAALRKRRGLRGADIRAFRTITEFRNSPVVA